ncbi:hypothetical protein M426DRAFT_240654 [Hypoxylon sp. CI-4A]|nr:hypothetical protein M426DRAFT_240654 [Hypoxylon sp. CI-4A]
MGCINMMADINDEPVGWQTYHGRRSTWSIIFSCISTIVACSWSVQHLNVPGRRDGLWTRFSRSLKWMVINVLFPEFIVIHAILELILAMQAFMEMATKRDYDLKYPWWYRNGRHERTKGNNDLEASRARGDVKWTLTHCFFANMGGIVYQQDSGSFPLTALQIAQGPLIHQNPRISQEKIEDSSKQDWFAKIVAALQFLQLVLSLIVRTCKGLAFSQLETITLGLAVCGAVIYLLYLYKPQNVNTPYEWAEPKQLSKSNTNSHVPIQSQKFQITFDSFWDILVNKSVGKDTINRIPNDNIPISRGGVAHPAIFLLAASSGLFGALHAIAWRFEFPTEVEQILWQTATVVAATSPVLGLITIPFLQVTRSWGNPQEFIRDCLRSLREYSWGASNEERDQAGLVYSKLEKLYAEIGEKREESYKDIFGWEQSPQLARMLLLFTQDETNQQQLGFNPNFTRQFRLLVELMDGTETNKRLFDEARTHVFPRRKAIPHPVNLAVFYATSLLYCLSRLSLLAIAFSSLRRMPSSVYAQTPWIEYIPSFGLSS